jgi:hypothetical protein
MSLILRRILTVVILLTVSFKVFAPSNNAIVIFTSQPYEPFRKLISAIGMVETKFDTLAYNPEEEAVGYFQIRPIRVQDYNERTGNSYQPVDMYDYKTSEKVFLYYASEIGPYNFEKIAKSWNGSGKKTLQYWKNVKKFL